MLKTNPRRCAECGCKVRGKNHSEGVHHKTKVKKDR